MKIKLFLMVTFINLVVFIPLNAYTIVDKGFPAPVTGVVLNESEVVDYFNLTHKKELLTKKIDILNANLYYIKEECKQEKKYYRNIVIYSFGGITVGVAITLSVMYLLRR